MHTSDFFTILCLVMNKDITRLSDGLILPSLFYIFLQIEATLKAVLFFFVPNNILSVTSRAILKD